MDFKQAENRFKQLKVKFEAGTVSESEFKTQLEDLMIQDEQGTWWMIGYETERWYRHDGTNWVQAVPPGSFSQKPKPVMPSPETIKINGSEIAPPEQAGHIETEKTPAATEKTQGSQPIVQRQSILKWILIGIVGLFVIAICAWGISYLANIGIAAPPPTEAPPETEEPSVSEAPAEELPEVGFAVMPGGALERAIFGDYAGTTVTVDGAFEGNDPDGVKFDQSMQAFEDATGITVNYVGSREFESNIYVRVDADDAPDIVDFPQPGLFANFVRGGYIVPVTDFISDEWLSQQYNPGWREFNTVDGVEAGVMHRYTGKSLVWYPKDDFEAAGYTVPETWEELYSLSYRIADDGGTPWCIGIESGAATGWVATDWTEDMMLRTTSLENYDAWVAGDLPFDSDEVKTAIAIWSEIWFDDALVYGGRSSIVSTFFGDSPGPMFEDPPQCWLHRQASFIPSFFPEGTEYGVDYDFFYLPPVDKSYGRPFLIAGDLMAMFNDRPEVRALMEYFTTPQSVSGWLEGGGAIAAQQTATQDMYGSDLDWNISQLVAGATSFRFDGSDLMPGEVGAGSFWEQITSYVAGSVDLDSAMQEIDSSWPR